MEHRIEHRIPCAAYKVINDENIENSWNYIESSGPGMLVQSGNVTIVIHPRDRRQLIYFAENPYCCYIQLFYSDGYMQGDLEINVDETLLSWAKVTAR